VDANPYVVLDIPETASLEEIEQAYRRKISDYHPDKVANAAPELKELAELRAREINAAFDELQKLRKQP
jgi:curved DNA-binding protein CbpA